MQKLFPLALLLLTAAAPPSTAPSQARNIDAALASLLAVTFKNDPVKTVFDHLHDTLHCNLVVNWPALKNAGITPDTPVNLALTAPATFEETIRDILISLPFKDTTGNYTVGGNALEITTTAELSKRAVPAINDIDRALTYAPTAKATETQLTAHAALLEKLLTAELIRQGEPLSDKSRKVVIKKTSIAANVSDRGQAVIAHVLDMFAAPAKPNTVPVAIPLTKPATTADAALAKLLTGPPVQTLASLAADPSPAKGKCNLLLLPGTDTAKPLASLTTPGGTILIGNTDALAPRYPLVVYDLRDVIKRTLARNIKKPPPSPEQIQQLLVAALQLNVPAPAGTKWTTDLPASGPTPAYTMLPSDGLLIVLAPTPTHRQLTTEIAKLYK